MSCIAVTDHLLLYSHSIVYSSYFLLNFFQILIITILIIAFQLQLNNPIAPYNVSPLRGQLFGLGITTLLA